MNQDLVSAARRVLEMWDTGIIAIDVTDEDSANGAYERIAALRTATAKAELALQK